MEFFITSDFILREFFSSFWKQQFHWKMALKCSLILFTEVFWFFFFFNRCHVFLWMYFIIILWVSSNGKSSFYLIPIVFQTKEIRFLNYWRSATSPSKYTVLTHRPSAKNFVKGYGNRTFLIWPMGFFSLNKASSVLKATAFMKVLVKIFHTHGLRD